VLVTDVVVEPLVEDVPLLVAVVDREMLGEGEGLFEREVLVEKVPEIVIVGEIVPEMDATAPPPEMVGTTDRDIDKDDVEVTDHVNVTAPDCVLVGVTLAREDTVLDAESVNDVVPVCDEDVEAVYDPDDVEHADELADAESVFIIVSGKVAVLAAVEEPHVLVVCDVVGVTLAHAVEVEETVDVGVVLPVCDPVEEPVDDPDEVGNAVELEEAEIVTTATVALMLEVVVIDCVLVRVVVMVPLVVGLFVDDAVAEGLSVEDELYVAVIVPELHAVVDVLYVFE